MSSSEDLCWFHGPLSRTDAEELIKSKIENHEGDNGLFLVRESSTAAGDFVLTLMNNDEVCHYQIRRHGEDALFSIADKEKILHGLDTLIKYYQEERDGLECKLTNFIRKDPPPNDSRSHGHTNLLHRATKENNQTVVSELLKCGYRNVDAKNQDGQTAIHLAALHCDESILRLLLEAGVNVNCMDTMGNMPLHYACRSKSAAFIRILISANANVQGRNIKNGYVPLHEAAKHGNVEAVVELLAAHAPLLPRTSSGEFPIDLAREAQQEHVVAYLHGYKQPAASTSRTQWYHGTLNRSEALDVMRKYVASSSVEQAAASAPPSASPASTPSLQEGGSPTAAGSSLSEGDGAAGSPLAEDPNGSGLGASGLNNLNSANMSGCFLVRYSEGKGYVLTVLCNDTIKNYIIAQTANYLYIDDGPFLPTLEHLVEHFMRFSDGLYVALKFPITPRPKPPLPLFSTMPKSLSRKSNNALLSPTSPTAAPTPMSAPVPVPVQKQPELKVERQRQNSLDDQKLHSVQKHSQFLTSPKKKAKEHKAGSVFATLRRSKNKAKKQAVAADERSPMSKEEELKQTETLFKSLKFSTEFANLQKSFDEVKQDGNSRMTLSSDGIYKVPTNNTAIAPWQSAANNNNNSSSAEVPSSGGAIESKSEEEILYLTQSDIQIERDRHNASAAAAAAGGATKCDTNGYIPTMDVLVLLGAQAVQAAALREAAQGNRLNSLISNVSNESEISRYLSSRSAQAQQPPLDADVAGGASGVADEGGDGQRALNYIIPSENLVLKAIIGEGEFGAVYSSNLVRVSEDGSTEVLCAVAVKMLQNEHCRKDKQEFLREASIMIRLNHHCIVQLLGISKGESLMMVQELMALGSMLQYIQNNRDKVNPNKELKLWASQIACGMQYLESQHFVHRDLAARNILLASLEQAKISDFGLSRILGTNNDCYHSSVGGRWPIKWYAPESANNGIFSHASDVWSFGVTLWEMFTLGEPPYGNLPCVNVLQLIEDGYRLAQPKLCTNQTYDVMKNCWNYKAKDRPSFRYLMNFFANSPEYQNLLELVRPENAGSGENSLAI